MSDTMSRKDRDQLAQVAKMRARVARASIEQRELVLRSQVEDELQQVFAAEEAAMVRAQGIATEVARRAADELEAKLDEADIVEQFRPALGLVNAEDRRRGTTESIAGRRAALRGIAVARIKSLGSGARVEIDRQCADTVTQLIAGGLDTAAAQRYLDAMPTVDQLMLAPSIAELEAVHDESRRQRREIGWSA